MKKWSVVDLVFEFYFDVLIGMIQILQKSVSKILALHKDENWLKTGYSRFCASDLLITNVDHIVQILHF